MLREEASASFRDLVCSCARNARTVAIFNRLFGANLQAPVALLLTDPPSWEIEPENETQQQSAHFVVFVRTYIWPRVLEAQRRHRRGETMLSVLKDEIAFSE